MTSSQKPSGAAESGPLTASLFGVRCLLVSFLLIASSTVADPGKQENVPLDERARAAAKTFAKDVKSLGRDIKNSEAGRALMQLGRDVRQITRAAWEDTLETRKKTLRELRKKNKELRRQVERKRKSREKGS